MIWHDKNCWQVTSKQYLKSRIYHRVLSSMSRHLFLTRLLAIKRLFWKKSYRFLSMTMRISILSSQVIWSMLQSTMSSRNILRLEFLNSLKLKSTSFKHSSIIFETRTSSLWVLIAIFCFDVSKKDWFIRQCISNSKSNSMLIFEHCTLCCLDNDYVRSSFTMYSKSWALCFLMLFWCQSLFLDKFARIWNVNDNLASMYHHSILRTILSCFQSICRINIEWQIKRFARMNNVRLSFIILWSNKMIRCSTAHCLCFWIFSFNEQMTITTIEFRVLEIRRRLFILNSCNKRTRSAANCTSYSTLSSWYNVKFFRSTSFISIIYERSMLTFW